MPIASYTNSMIATVPVVTMYEWRKTQGQDILDCINNVFVFLYEAVSRTLLDHITVRSHIGYWAGESMIPHNTITLDTAHES